MTADEHTSGTAATLLDYLENTPARVVLDQLALPVLTVGSDGHISYSNAAFAEMVGAPSSVAGQQLTTFFAQPREGDAVEQLRTMTGRVTTWRHGEGYDVRAVVSHSVLQRNDDSELLLTLRDVTAADWSHGAGAFGG